MYNVLIVEDDNLARQLFEIYLSSQGRYRLAAAIDNADFADVYCVKSNIDLILMDIHTAMNANGLEAAERIKRRFPSIKIVMVTSMPEFSYLERARKIGVDGFWYKTTSKETLLELIDRTMRGERVFPEQTPIVRLGNALSVDFTLNELEILRELTTGNPDAIIASHLNMSVSTVKTHIQRLREKTGFRNRTELAVRARESGLVIGGN